MFLSKMQGGVMNIAVVKQSYNESLCQRRYYGEAILALLRVGMIGPICTLIDRERAF